MSEQECSHSRGDLAPGALLGGLFTRDERRVESGARAVHLRRRFGPGRGGRRARSWSRGSPGSVGGSGPLLDLLAVPLSSCRTMLSSELWTCKFFPKS